VAREKVQARGLEEKIQLHVGNAVELDKLMDLLPVEPTGTASRGKEEKGGGGGGGGGKGRGGFDKVISLDSAYHYKTRRVFLEQAMKVLKVGGRICLADLILWKKPKSLQGKLLLKIVCRVVGIPEENLVDSDEYIAMFYSLGYKDIQVRFIEEYVFIGLSKFLNKHQADLGDLVRPNLWTRYNVMSRILKTIHDHKVLRFVIVTATKDK
jgi:SAM-dependent methyltransferase